MIFDRIIENEYIQLKVQENGSLRLFDKISQKVFRDLLVFEETGDIGNEYIYFQPTGTKPILSTDLPTTSLLS